MNQKLLESAMLRCWICSSLRNLSPFTFSCLLLLATVVTVSGLTCPDTCDCSEVDTSNCQYGIVRDVCGCCDVCGLGPGGDCSLEQCGPDYECVRLIPEEAPPGYHFTEQELEDLPGICKHKIAPVSPPTPVPANSSNITTDCDDSSGNEDDEEPMDEHTCRPKCSIEFCSQRSSQRICSAQGMEFTKVSQRNGCQHTSCFACYIVIRPPCEHRRCPEPPNKRCLREFYSCILDHYFYAVESNRPHLMRINDPRRNLYPGKLFCDVPEVS